MFKRLFVYMLLLAASPLAAQVVSALPADHLALANQLSKRGLYADAIREYEAIRNEKSLPQDEICFRLGEAYRNVGRAQNAIAIYGSLIRKYPQSRYVDFARLNRALLLTGAERTKELASLDHDGVPEQIRVNALYWMGESASAAGNSKEAIAWYTRSGEVAKTNSIARLARFKAAGLLAASSDAADRAKAQIDYLDIAKEDDAEFAQDALFEAAMLSYRDGRYSGAAKLFRRMTETYPKYPRLQDCQLYAAWSNYLAGHFTEAIAIAAPLREAKNEDAYYIVAASLRFLERRKDSEEAYAAALAAFPKGRHADAEWFERLSVLAASNDHAAVLAALKQRPDPPEKTADRAWSFGCEAAIAVTNFPRAIEFARLVAKRGGATAPVAVHRLAWLYEKTGDWPRAAQAYRLLADKWPDAPVAAQALYLAGVSEAKNGHVEQARADWTKLLAKHPKSEYAPQALYARAVEEIRKKDFRLAQRSLGELLERFPKFPLRNEALYWCGVAAKGANDMPEAERMLRAALKERQTVEFAREIKLEFASILLAKPDHSGETEAAEIFRELLSTKAVERIPPATLQFVGESMLSVTNYAAALTAAQIIESRKIAADWTQIGASIAGAAHEGLGEGDAAIAAYKRALASNAKTVAGARAALALGKLETAGGRFDDAKTHLVDAVERAHSPELLALRVQAYVALAANEEERGDLPAALGYHMLVGTLFDDATIVPRALRRAAAILRKQGRTAEADQLDRERIKRYPKSAGGK